jgi:hypothetical protein
MFHTNLLPQCHHEGITFLQNDCIHLQDYMVSYPRRSQSKHSPTPIKDLNLTKVNFNCLYYFLFLHYPAHTAKYQCYLWQPLSYRDHRATTQHPLPTKVGTNIVDKQQTVPCGTQSNTCTVYCSSMGLVHLNPLMANAYATFLYLYCPG